MLRNTEGQMVSKQFSEKLVVKKLMEALTQMDEAAGWPGRHSGAKPKQKPRFSSRWRGLDGGRRLLAVRMV